MRLHDAPEGAVLIDRDGDVWVRLRSGAVFIRREPDGGVVRWKEAALVEGGKLFHPFTVVDTEPDGALSTLMRLAGRGNTFADGCDHD